MLQVSSACPGVRLPAIINHRAPFEYRSALSANDPSGKWVPAQEFLPAFESVLFLSMLRYHFASCFEILSADDRLVMICHVKLIPFPMIVVPLEAEIGILLLQKTIADVLLVLDYSLNCST